MHCGQISTSHVYLVLISHSLHNIVLHGTLYAYILRIYLRVLFQTLNSLSDDVNDVISRYAFSLLRVKFTT